MDCVYIVVSSVTYALKAQKELEMRGIYSKIEKIKKISAVKGCTYGVKVGRDMAAAAIRIMKMTNIKVVNVIDCEANKK